MVDFSKHIKKPLDERLKDITPPGVNFMDDPDIPTKREYNIEITATEKQLDHLRNHMRTMRIAFKVTEQ